MNVPFGINSLKTMAYTQLFLQFETPPFLPFLYCFLEKPWFWEKQLLIRDEVDGIVYDYMFPKAPVNWKHPCFQLKNYFTPCPYYADARNRNTGALHHASVKED